MALTIFTYGTNYIHLRQKLYPLMALTVILSISRLGTKTASPLPFSIAAPSIWNSLPATIQAARASVHSDRSSKHTCTILALIDNIRYLFLCSFWNSSALQILTLTLTLTLIISSYGTNSIHL